MSHNALLRTLFGVFRGGSNDTSKILSFDVKFYVMCDLYQPWARQNLQATLKIEQTLSQR